MYCKRLVIFVTLFITVFLHNANAGTYSGVLDTGETLKPGHGRGSFEFFSAFNRGGQVNPLLHAQYGLIENLDLNAFIGTGTVEFQSGAGGQYMLLPDLPGQIGISVSTNVRYLLDHTSAFYWETYPTLSKRFREWSVDWTPYGSLQFGLEARNLFTRARFDLVLGAEIRPVSFNALKFFTEFGFNLYRSSWSFALQASIQIDDLSKWDNVELP